MAVSPPLKSADVAERGEHCDSRRRTISSGAPSSMRAEAPGFVDPERKARRVVGNVVEHRAALAVDETFRGGAFGIDDGIGIEFQMEVRHRIDAGVAADDHRAC